MGDLLRALAFAFRRKGADAMPGSDMRLLLAYDLRWFAPEDAKRAVARGIELGLLHEEDGVVRPAFDPAKVDIPVNFRPTPAALEEEAPEDVPMPAAQEPAPARPAPVDPRVEAERARRGGLVTSEVAALLVARRDGEDVAGRLAEAEARILKG